MFDNFKDARLYSHRAVPKNKSQVFILTPSSVLKNIKKEGNEWTKEPGYIWLYMHDRISLSNVEMENASTPSTLMEMKTRRQPFHSQMSTLDTRRRQAVCVRRAFKKYGSKSNPHVVLDGLNMTVPKGTM